MELGHRSRAWLLIGLFGNEAGDLELSEGRLAFEGELGTCFDVPLTEVSAVAFPWFYFGGGLQLTAGSRRYRFAFVRPTAEGGRLADVPEGRQVGAAWRRALDEAGLLNGTSDL